MSRAEVLVVGGGISGLSTAWGLAQQGIPVEVWEKAPRLGGKICTNKNSGYITEQAASLLLNFRPEVDRCIEAAGLTASKQSQGKDLNRYVVRQGKLTEVPMQLSRLARSSLWSRQAKLRLLAEVFMPRSRQSHESVSQFISRRLGREILDSSIEPFIAGILASDPDYADARTVLPRLTELERQYGSITAGMFVNRIIKRRRINRSEAFSFNQGMEELIHALSSHPLIRLKTNCAVDEIQFQNNRWHLQANHGKQHHARHLIISTPANHTANLLFPIDSDLSSLVGDIQYAPLSVVHLGFDRSQIQHSLNGGGFLTARQEKLSFNGNLWMSSLFSNRTPSGKVLLTSYVGGARHPERCSWSDDQQVSAVTSDLNRLIGLRGSPEFIHIDRHHQALPLYYGNYQKRLSAITERLEHWPGLHLVANYQGGISVRERIYQGMKAAQLISKTRESPLSTFHNSTDKVTALAAP